MVKDTCTISGPGDSPSEPGAYVYLVDQQSWPDTDFEATFAGFASSRSIEEVTNGGRSDYRVRDRAALDALESKPFHVLFFASCDTHVKTMVRLARRCSNYTFVIRAHRDGAAARTLEAEGMPYDVHRRSMEVYERADVALLCTDWGFEERVFIQHCRRNGIPTACLQESVNVDFDGPMRRMRWANYVLLQGPHALRYLRRDVSFLTGNPRYDGLSPVDTSLEALVLINCNFTFGVGVEWGRKWLDQVVHAARDLRLPYRISVHPRDELDLTGVDHLAPSGAYNVRDQMAACRVLVSRDSALPYEALLLNRHAIYYNPYGESERCLSEDDSGLIHKCSDAEGLRECLERLVDAPGPMDDGRDFQGAYRMLFTATDGHNDRRVVRALALIAQFGKGSWPDDMEQEGYLKARANVILQMVLRPMLRSVPVLRALWRAGKRLLNPQSKE